MAAAPLKAIVQAEAVGAVVVAAAALIWTGAVAKELGVPWTFEVFALIRLAAALLIAFGAMLWGSRRLVVTSADAIMALAIGHGIGAAVLVLQFVAIWPGPVGMLIAATPLGLAWRYGQCGLRMRRTDAVIAGTAGA